MKPMTVLVGIILIAFFCLVAIFTISARAHDFYSKYKDPVHGTNCCGGTDCAPWKLKSGSITPTKGGYRVRLSIAEARQINPEAKVAIDTWVASERVIAAPNGEWNICIRPTWRDQPDFGVICLFGPGTS